MHILIRIGLNGITFHELVSRSKNKLENHIKDLGFYYSKKVGYYIDDKTVKIKGGSGTAYIIEEIDEI